MVKILIGADPEFFVKKNGEYVSAHGLVNGTKEAPQPVKGGAVQVDGMALEFNINPAANWREWDTSFTTVLEGMRKLVPAEYTFHFDPVAHFGKDYIDQQPEEAKKLGCTPDYNAYTGEQNPTPNGELPFRTASGHVHIGWTEDMDPYDPDHFEACCMLTKQLDVCLGIPSLMWDADSTRRELYGKAGAFRPKSYGMEYRVLSNAWLSNVDLRQSIFHMTLKATKSLLDGKDYSQYIGTDLIQSTINSSNLDKALDIIAALDILPTIYGATLFQNKYKERKTSTLQNDLAIVKKVKGKKVA